MIMKKFTLFLILLKIFVFETIAQEKLYVCENGGNYTEFFISDIDSIVLAPDAEPYTPDNDYKVFLQYSLHEIM